MTDELDMAEATEITKEIQNLIDDGLFPFQQVRLLVWESRRAARAEANSEADKKYEAIIERDRTRATMCLNGIEKAIHGHEWLKLGRGSYEYSDDRWRDEFKDCILNIEAALEFLKELARDWSNCPKKHTEIMEARTLIDKVPG